MLEVWRSIVKFIVYYSFSQTDDSNEHKRLKEQKDNEHCLYVVKLHIL